MTDLSLRPWRLSDAADVARYANNEKIAANLRDVFPWPYSRRAPPQAKPCICVACMHSSSPMRCRGT